jgi:HK97 family phage major capsid protein
MKITRNHLTIGFLAIVAVLAVFALAGHPILPVDALAGLGMLPLAMSGEIDMKEIKTLLEVQGAALEKFKKSVESDILAIATKNGRPSAGGLISPLKDEHTKAFMGFLRSGREADLEQKVMRTDSGPEGGYLVPEQLDTELSKYLRQRSPMRQLARVVPVGSAEFKQPHSTLGTGASWVGETAARPATAAPGLKMITIPTNEVYAMPSITQQLLDDNAFDLENWLITELGDAFGDAEANAFINGNGVTQPRGLFTYDVVTTADATREHDKFQYVPTGASGDFAASNPGDALISLVYAVKPQYRANASWLISSEVLEKVRKMKDGTGAFYLWQPSTQAGQPSTLLGFPVFEDENLPAIASGSLSAAFGDFSRSYTITDRNTAMLRDPYTSKPFVNFYSTKRLGGGGGRDTRAVKFLKFAST